MTPINLLVDLGTHAVPTWPSFSHSITTLNSEFGIHTYPFE